MKILVIDDEPLLAPAIARWLRSEGHDASHTTSGLEGIQTIRNAEAIQEPFNYVILDIVLPDLMGYEFSELIIQFKNPPKIIFTSGFPERDPRMGAWPLLEKPVDLDELLLLLI